MSIEAIKRLLRPVERRVRTMIVRAVLDAVDDAGGFQVVRVEGLADSDTPDFEHMQPGGLSHNPEAGAEGLALRVGADGSHVVLIGLSNRNRRTKNLQPGETALYVGGALAGTRIKCVADGSIEITPGGVSPKVTITGDLEVSGEVTAGNAVPANAVSLTTHLHPTAMGPSGAPTPGT